MRGRQPALSVWLVAAAASTVLCDQHRPPATAMASRDHSFRALQAVTDNYTIYRAVTGSACDGAGASYLQPSGTIAFEADPATKPHTCAWTIECQPNQTVAVQLTAVGTYDSLPGDRFEIWDGDARVAALLTELANEAEYGSCLGCEPLSAGYFNASASWISVSFDSDGMARDRAELELSFACSGPAWQPLEVLLPLREGQDGPGSYALALTPEVSPPPLPPPACAQCLVCCCMPAVHALTRRPRTPSSPALLACAAACASRRLRA